MAFGARQINPLDLDNSIAVGINLPLNGNAVFKPNFQTKDAIKSSLINYFLTNPGERYLNPGFGGGLREFIFEQINSESLDFLREDINNKLNSNFPNLNINDVVLTGNSEENRITINIKYSVPSTNISDEIIIDL
tara:strand:+ start:437 stop:841 length:405 start_codon:yes stop_codon:yes gene_type:complete